MNDNGYVILEYKDGERTERIIYTDAELWAAIDNAHNLQLSIVIYALGKCLIDWS